MTIKDINTIIDKNQEIIIWNDLEFVIYQGPRGSTPKELYNEKIKGIDTIISGEHEVIINIEID